MAFKFSSELRRQQCVVGSLKSILDGGLVRVYSGPVPYSADSAVSSSNVTLCDITNNGEGLTFEATAGNATLTKSLSEIWQGNNLENGEATFFRFIMPSDSGSASTGEVRMQGTVGGPAQDLTISNANLVKGAPQRLEYFAIALLESA